MSNENYEFMTRCQFNSYCKKTVGSALIDYYRKNRERWRRETQIGSLSDFDQEAFPTTADDFETERAFYIIGDRIVSKADLYKAIDSLPEKNGSVIKLYYFEEYNDGEIARMLNLPRKTANNRRNSGLRAMQKYFEDDSNGTEE